MNCTLKVARGLNYCWRRLPQPQNLPDQVRLLSHRRFDWRNYNPESPSQLRSQQHRFDNPSMGEYMEQPMASSERRGPVWEPRRRTIMQDPEEHQRRQNLIIEENKRRWTRGGGMRRNAQAPGVSKPDLIYDADRQNRQPRRPSQPRRKGKNSNRAAKDYSRKRMSQRKRELKRQARELRKSRRGYNLPGSDTRAEVHDEDVTMRRQEDAYEHYGSSEWLRKREDAEEAKYWHSWHTCPSQRCDENLDSDEDHIPSGPRTSPSGYYESRRSFHHMQLPSIRSPHYQVVANRLVKRRKPIGLEKRCRLFIQQQAEEELEDESVLEDNPPQVVLRKRSENAKMERTVKPPRFDMTIQRVKREPAPVCSFSEQLNISSPSNGYAGGTSSSLYEKWCHHARLHKGFKRGG
ncbi:uncharacterized protein LOC117892260 [Drosophila subobscura]|uniref:uncharacterized protein LOC117892260 n=1 Tax=Drosophila subobscura TaxID=7241 RepID=UPI00155AF9EB|nr:uncharacterized protein LOC117892260 [Drosophila subobscura]